jgi:predicted metal-binding protein
MREIIVCTTCRYSADAKTGPDGRTGGEMLLAEMREAAGDARVRSQECLWNCTRHCSVLIRDTGKFSYIAGGFRPGTGAAPAILAWFAMHGETGTGEVPFRQWPDAMRGHFIARIPPAAP